jgi:hypothetical protein
MSQRCFSLKAATDSYNILSHQALPQRREPPMKASPRTDVFMLKVEKQLIILTFGFSNISLGSHIAEFISVYFRILITSSIITEVCLRSLPTSPEIM